MNKLFLSMMLAGLFAVNASPAQADYRVQCPDAGPDTRCFTLLAGDGFIKGADGSDIYIFGFVDGSGRPWSQLPEALPAADFGFKPGDAIAPPEMYMMNGDLKANFPAPTLVMSEGDTVYLTVSNSGMHMRPDLFDPHTVHFHGFPNAAPVFDGVPESSFGAAMGASLTYFYKPLDPGTYMWHCHQEASEHLQMGMIGQLIVLPKQDGQDKLFDGRHFTRFAYDDGDGSTGYDKAYPIQIGSFDPKFHKDEVDVQPPDFMTMKDTLGMLNGRGYPDTINPAVIENVNGDPSQKLHTLIEARGGANGERVLLRVSSLSTTRFFTVTALGVPMKVVAIDARRLVGPGGSAAYYDTGSFTLGGGQSIDVIVDLKGVSPGTYFLYSTNLNYLSNDGQDYGGMMTEIRVTN